MTVLELHEALSIAICEGCGSSPVVDKDCKEVHTVNFDTREYDDSSGIWREGLVLQLRPGEWMK